MPKVSFAFFATAAAFLLCGMSLGMWMGAHQTFTLAPVHAHLNLIGWASMSIMGGFFALAGERAPMRLAWTVYGLATAAVIGMTPALGMVITGHMQAMPVLVASEFTAFAAGILFFAAVLITWRRASSRPAMPALGAVAPAE